MAIAIHHTVLATGSGAALGCLFPCGPLAGALLGGLSAITGQSIRTYLYDPAMQAAGADSADQLSITIRALALAVFSQIAIFFVASFLAGVTISPWSAVCLFLGSTWASVAIHKILTTASIFLQECA